MSAAFPSRPGLVSSRAAPWKSGSPANLPGDSSILYICDAYRVASVRVGARRITGRLLHARAGRFRSRGAAPHNAERLCSLCSNPAGQGPLPNAAGGARLVHLVGPAQQHPRALGYRRQGTEGVTRPLVGSPWQDRVLALREDGPVGFQWLWGACRRLSVRRDNGTARSL